MRAHQLKISVMTGLLIAWPLFAHAKTLETADTANTSAPTHVSVSHTTPLSTNDPLQRWFKEQDKLLDDILTRLSRMETLVNTLHRLIQQFPAAPATAMPMLPLPPLAVVPQPPPRATGLLGFFDEWGSLLAGGCLLLLVLMISARNRRAKQSLAKRDGEPGTTAR